MRIADIWIEEPFENISANEACLVTSQRNNEEIANDNREWKKSANSFDNVPKFISGEIQFVSKKDYEQWQQHSNQVKNFTYSWIAVIRWINAVKVFYVD